jgi:YfiH family protein
MILKYISTINDGDLRDLNNKQTLCKKHNLNFKNLKYMKQVHGNHVEVVNENQSYECDALITNKKDTALLVLVADCIPILFHDNTNNVIGVAHAGRNGTFLQIAKNTIEKMMCTFDCEAKNIHVEIGPSIQKCCYEVNQSMVDIVKKSFGIEFTKNRNIDLQGINKRQILDLGIKEENLIISKTCTKCTGDDYFSYRNNNECGRFGALICNIS